MAIMGDDVRWVGNEKGLGRETEWSATVLTPGIYTRSEENNKRLGVFSKAKDLGSRSMLAEATELFYSSGMVLSCGRRYESEVVETFVGYLFPIGRI